MNKHICDTVHWEIKLNDDQHYLARCVVVLRRDCGELSEVTDEEFMALLEIIRYLEKGIKEEFGATMFNWTCLMNDAYKETNDLKPRVHLHVRPRYKEKVKFEGVEFEDTEFAHHYERKTNRDVGEGVSRKIILKLREILKDITFKIDERYI
jgi:diadenosine tetraphosphate (Ap4A) HIT family hydrolase